jgi:rSAM/selenodomain-associated transferase 2
LISVVIPAWNEERALPGTLRSVFAQTTSCEVIVADGGSSDGTGAIAAADTRIQLVSAPKGRASQMNAGAQRARGEWILFLHADTWLPPGALSAIATLPPDVAAGCFRHRFSGRDWRLRLISRLHDWRFSVTGIIYGDQAMFVRRTLFDRLGGFPAVAHLEDVLFSEQLVPVTRPRMIDLTVETESRKFEQMGIWKSLGRVLVILACHELRLPVPTRFFRDIR